MSQGVDQTTIDLAGQRRFGQASAIEAGHIG